MNLLANWWNEYARGHIAPLFAEKNLEVETFDHKGKRKLRRSEAFDQLMIQTVEDGLEKDSWQGFVYVMHWEHSDSFIPLYIGKSEKRGVSKPISYNIENIRKNQHAFGRWGYGLAYHIGDLSHAMYRETAYKKPSPKYDRWARLLFKRYDPPTLNNRVYVAIITWFDCMRGPSGLIGSVPSVEKELIALASSIPDVQLLNFDGR